MIEGAEARVRALACWRGEIEVEPLQGGLSNASFRVRDDEGLWVARIGRDFPFHHVSREREAAASRSAHAAGFSPQVRYSGDGVLVSAFVQGQTLDAQGARARLDRIVALVAALHAEMPRRVRGPPTMFWVFHVIRDYFDTLAAGGHAFAAEAARLAPVVDALEAAQVPAPIVFGHHDLLPANLIDDGVKLWLIDWEYAAFGTPLFDLANLADNAGFSPQEESRLLGLYFRREPDAALLHAFEAMKVASALRESLWAFVSELHLAAPGADYAAYGQTCLARFETALAAYAQRT
jgi:thiamine kinase-like enzyme